MNADVSLKPFVSALLVIRNEEKHVEKALLSLINQTYPKDRYEIIIVDGESTDNTLKIVAHVIECKQKDLLNIKVINNSKHNLVAGWNLGIKIAQGEYVVRIDGHAEATTDFIEKNVETIQSVPDAVCVGGKLITMSVNQSDDTISKVLSSPFGVGNSSFRVSDEAGYADTAVYGLYKKEIFEQIGYFNEKYVRNQDLEFHSRINAMGGRFYFNPLISCIYYSRNSILKMVKQAIGNGKWNMVLLKNDISALRWRHLVPIAFALFLVSSTALGGLDNIFWYLEGIVLLLYFVLGAVAAIGKTHNIVDITKMLFIFFILHLSYGSGYLTGIFTKVDKGK